MLIQVVSVDQLFKELFEELSAILDSSYRGGWGEPLKQNTDR